MDIFVVGATWRQGRGEGGDEHFCGGVQLGDRGGVKGEMNIFMVGATWRQGRV